MEDAWQYPCPSLQSSLWGLDSLCSKIVRAREVSCSVWEGVLDVVHELDPLSQRAVKEGVIQDLGRETLRDSG